MNLLDIFTWILLDGLAGMRIILFFQVWGFASDCQLEQNESIISHSMSAEICQELYTNFRSLGLRKFVTHCHSIGSTVTFLESNGISTPRVQKFV